MPSMLRCCVDAKSLMNQLCETLHRRVVAETNMNEVSSRSHAIFVIAVTKVDLDLETGAEGFTTSKVRNFSEGNESLYTSYT